MNTHQNSYQYSQINPILQPAFSDQSLLSFHIILNLTWFILLILCLEYFMGSMLIHYFICLPGN